MADGAKNTHLKRWVFLFIHNSPLPAQAGLGDPCTTSSPPAKNGRGAKKSFPFQNTINQFDIKINYC